MTIEREVKLRIPCNSLDRIRDLLEKKGFSVVVEQREVDIYYSHPCRDFMDTDEALRLRVTDGGIRLTYKGPRKMRDGVKERVELEAPVGEGVTGILEALGFREALRVTKERVYYTRDGYTVTLDRVEGLGCFVEVEGSDPWLLVEDLGLKELGAERVDATYVELALEKMKGSKE